MRVLLFMSCILIGFLNPLQAQPAKTKGPVIENYGAVYGISHTDFKVATTEVLKVVFDVGRSYKNKNKPNPLIETAARFLNLHAQHGYNTENLHVALVIHGEAAYDLLTDKVYQSKFQTPNPNTALIKELDEAGVEFVLCGQTAAYRNITKKEALPQIKWALSAMTALVHLQNINYRLIKF